MRRTTDSSESEEEDERDETDDDDDDNGRDHEKEVQNQQAFDETPINRCIDRLKKAVQNSDEAIENSHIDIATKWVALVKSRQDTVTEWHEQMAKRQVKRSPRGGIRTGDQQLEAREVPQNKSFAVWA